MKKFLLSLAAFCLLAALPGQAQTTQKTVNLFNGKNLKGWTGYLKAASMNPQKEFKAGDGVIRLSGEYGYIRTEVMYENYRLKVEWRWPEELSNSGIFLHVQPEFKIWPTNFECQLWTGKAGDIYCAGAAACDQSRSSKEAVVPKQKPSNEKPLGEWNQAEILSVDGTITVWINGEQQNEVTGLSNTKGYIGLQSEGKPVEFRNVVLTLLPVAKTAKPAKTPKAQPETTETETETK